MQPVDIWSVLDYDPFTGEFEWRRRRGNRSAGSSPGYVKSDGYLVIKVNGKKYFAHRLAWFYMHGEWPTSHLDHIDHDKLNNRISNLREVTPEESSRNCSLRRANKSGCSGVTWQPSCNKWQVRICVGKRKEKYLGVYADLNEAIAVRKKAERDFGYHPNHGKPREAIAAAVEHVQGGK